MKKALVLIFFLFGCVPKEVVPKYTFSATFFDTFTNEPIEGIRISSVDAVYSSVLSVLGGASTRINNNIFYSNKDGLILIPFNKFERAERYTFYFSKNEKYFEPLNANITATEFDSQKNIKKTYRLDSKAQFRLKVNLKTQLKDGESIRIIVAAEYDITITNKYIHEDKISVLIGNVPLNYTKIYTINGVETRVREILTLKPFVVNDYEFTY